MNIIQASKVAKLSDYLPTPSDEVDVDQGEWRYGVGKMCTSSVASCIVLAAYNLTSKHGLLGHFSCISPIAKSNPQLSNEHSDTEAYIEAVDFLHTLGPIQSTKIWLGGSALYDVDRSSIRNSTLADRLYAEAKVNELITKYHVRGEAVYRQWNTAEYDLYIRLDCISGSLLVQPTTD